jgi:tetratricopeptide (TPR) repeat protein
MAKTPPAHRLVWRNAFPAIGFATRRAIVPATSADRTIGLGDAVKEIAGACRDAEHRNFVLVVGAGISQPPVPLSSEITGFCKEQVLKADPATPDSTDKTAMGQYSYWFQKAFPQPYQQQQYLESLIKNKPLSLASLRLAHILMSGKVANVVVTPNFDDFVARALRLFGEPDFRLCDHPRMVDCIDLEAKTIQIVHVHGAYQFYDMANLGGEIERRAEISEETTLTISDPVGRIFENRSPLIIGYSGWQGDVIMTALKRRLQDRRLACNSYFFCYHRSAIDGLPSWLTSHQDVRFVAPAETASRLPTDTQMPAILAATGGGSYPEQLMSYSASLRPSAGDTEPTLRAEEVLDELIRALSLEVPDLFKDPLDLLEQQILVAHLPGNESDLYGFGSVLRDIKSARVCLASQKAQEEAFDRQLESVRDAIRRSQYNQAISAASIIDLLHLSAEKKKELFLALRLVTAAAERKEDTISAVEIMERIYDSLGAPHRDKLAPNLAEALVSKGIALSGLERAQDEVAAYDEVLRRFGDSSDPAIRERLATALQFKGITFRQLERAEDAIAIYDEIDRRFADSTIPAVLRRVAGALVSKGFALASLGRAQDEVAAYD